MKRRGRRVPSRPIRSAQSVTSAPPAHGPKLFARSALCCAPPPPTPCMTHATVQLALALCVASGRDHLGTQSLSVNRYPWDRAKVHRTVPRSQRAQKTQNTLSRILPLARTGFAQHARFASTGRPSKSRSALKIRTPCESGRLDLSRNPRSSELAMFLAPTTFVVPIN